MDIETSMRCKGVPDRVQKTIDISDYDDGVTQKDRGKKRSFNAIRNHQRQLFTQTITKRVFSQTTKRILINGNKDSLPIGYSGLKKIQYLNNKFI